MRINGRRGAFQISLGSVFLLIGLNYFIDPTPSLSFAWFYDYLPYHLLGAHWFITGVVAIFSSFLPRPKDWLSFALLTFSPAAHGSIYIFSLVTGDSDTFLAPLMFYGLAGMVIIVSGMQGPADRDIRKIEVKL